MFFTAGGRIRSRPDAVTLETGGAIAPTQFCFVYTVAMHIVWASTFVVVHLVYWFSITFVEAYESRTGMIPARRPWDDPHPFPYFCDWYTCSWGDLIGLTLIDWSAGYAFSFSIPSLKLALVSVVVGALGAAIFHLLCMSRRHKPDSGYPAPGKRSPHALAHEWYFFLQLTLCALLVELAVTHELVGLPLRVALVGGAVYAVCFFADLYLGYFSPRKS